MPAFVSPSLDFPLRSRVSPTEREDGPCIGPGTLAYDSPLWHSGAMRELLAALDAFFTNFSEFQTESKANS